MSVPQMPTPATSTTTSVGPGVGSSTCSTDSFPGASNTTARTSLTSVPELERRKSVDPKPRLAGLAATHGRIEDHRGDQDRAGDHQLHGGREGEEVHPIGDGAD